MKSENDFGKKSHKMNKKRKNKKVVATAPESKKTTNDLLSLLTSVCLALDPYYKDEVKNN